MDIDLDAEGEPSCQPDVDQAQVGIEEVEVEHALRPACVDQAGAVLGVGQLEAGAAFHAAEDADQPFADRPLSQELVDELILAAGRLEVLVLGAGLRQRDHQLPISMHISVKRLWASCIRRSEIANALSQGSKPRYLRWVNRAIFGVVPRAEQMCFDGPAGEAETDGALTRCEFVVHGVLRGAAAGGCPRGTF